MRRVEVPATLKFVPRLRSPLISTTDPSSSDQRSRATFHRVYADLVNRALFFWVSSFFQVVQREEQKRKRIQGLNLTSLEGPKLLEKECRGKSAGMFDAALRSTWRFGSSCGRYFKIERKSEDTLEVNPSTFYFFPLRPQTFYSDFVASLSPAARFIEFRMRS